MAELDLANATDEELVAEADRLAAQKVEVRQRQNAVQAEQETRKLLAGVSGATREALYIKLGGGVKPSGGAEAQK